MAAGPPASYPTLILLALSRTRSALEQGPKTQLYCISRDARRDQYELDCAGQAGRLYGRHPFSSRPFPQLGVTGTGSSQRVKTPSTA
ncbi:hypothetical protein PF005_g18274 [Phytophthora fragariae]|uniref:Uncharacterized protein n=1 Tax=Phytophthora fragariae TaxID=53985 RepID=A0A6A3S3A2_9STRA|nr:hypothetical protein PF003_g36151 [Phytophthora fragariae]KAE8928565.1 hypothetical protein PF009_g21301 [Phytophthora fragariae]KAE8980378.1 hypothetical protein PF011_g22463 [Phytophthora fragariae]KAE9087418.1 hypothetical protein PF007_g20386 [Phytophthora fragariae]KAE9105057.1 hypothetical protein PF006_g21745 [Phytophthora fragariae]